jgi:hypothetical protein
MTLNNNIVLPSNLMYQIQNNNKKIGMWEDEHIDHDRIELNLISVMSYIYINIRWNCYVLSDPIYLMLP